MLFANCVVANTFGPCVYMLDQNLALMVYSPLLAALKREHTLGRCHLG